MLTRSTSRTPSWYAAKRKACCTWSEIETGISVGVRNLLVQTYLDEFEAIGSVAQEQDATISVPARSIDFVVKR
jgi:hypothetical protein